MQRDYTLCNGDWDWKRIGKYLPKEYHSYVSIVLYSRDENERNRLVWKLSSNGRFSAANEYEAMCLNRWNQPDQKWKELWMWKGPERTKTFLWIVLHDALLTNTQRARRGMVASQECERCREGTETVEHGLRGYWRTTSLWYKILPGTFCSFMSKQWESWPLSNITSEEFVEGNQWAIIFGFFC